MEMFLKKSQQSIGIWRKINNISWQTKSKELLFWMTMNLPSRRKSLEIVDL